MVSDPGLCSICIGASEAELVLWSAAWVVSNSVVQRLAAQEVCADNATRPINESGGEASSQGSRGAGQSAGSQNPGRRRRWRVCIISKTFPELGLVQKIL